MRPRIILRTHYQADEPRVIIATVTHCSSATDSRHEDAVAAGLMKWARANQFTLSLPGAMYAVGNARTLGLLNDAHRWTAGGLSFGYLHATCPAAVGPVGLTLAVPEQRLYFKLYLQHGGALLVKFARWLLERRQVSDDELRTGSVIEQLLIEGLDEYLTIVTDIRDRTAIRRERERISRSDYASSTKRHKRYPLLRTMRRLGLISDTNPNDASVIAPDPEGRLAALNRLVPDVTTLERFAKEDNLYAVVEGVYGTSAAKEGSATTLVGGAYSYAMGLGLQACPLAYLDDVVFATSVGKTRKGGGAPGPAEELLEPLHRDRPSEVRFHVDRRGRRAFVLVTGEALQSLVGKTQRMNAS
jgi:hypothetical protein